MGLKKTYRLWALAAFLVTLAPGWAWAQLIDDSMLSDSDPVELAEAGLGAEQELDELTLLVVPVPVADPTLGNGGTLAGIATFNADGLPESPRSTLAIAAGYVDEGSWWVGGGGALHLAGDRHRLSLVVGYASINLDYFGRSSDSVFFRHPLPFNLEGSLVSTHAQTRIADNLYVGAIARSLKASASLNVRFDRIRNLTFSPTLNAAGPTLEYDTRDWHNAPTDGNHASVRYLIFNERLGSDFDFASSEAWWRNYQPLTNEIVLASEARVAHTSDDAPFFMLPFVNFRGFPAGQYLGSSIAQIQSELRWSLGKDVVLNAFGGLGAVFVDDWNWDDANQVWGAGLGARYRVSEADRLNLGFDIATGSAGGFALYFSVGEAF